MPAFLMLPAEKSNFLLLIPEIILRIPANNHNFSRKDHNEPVIFRKKGGHFGQKTGKWRKIARKTLEKTTYTGRKWYFIVVIHPRSPAISPPQPCHPPPRPIQSTPTAAHHNAGTALILHVPIFFLAVRSKI